MLHTAETDQRLLRYGGPGPSGKGGDVPGNKGEVPGTWGEVSAAKGEVSQPPKGMYIRS